MKKLAFLAILPFAACAVEKYEVVVENRYEPTFTENGRAMCYLKAGTNYGSEVGVEVLPLSGNHPFFVGIGFGAAHFTDYERNWVQLEGDDYRWEMQTSSKEYNDLYHAFTLGLKLPCGVNHALLVSTKVMSPHHGQQSVLVNTLGYETKLLDDQPYWGQFAIEEHYDDGEESKLHYSLSIRRELS